MSLFCPGVPSRMPHYIQSPCLRGLLLAVTTSETSLVLMARTVLRSTGEGLCRRFLRLDVWSLLMIPLRLRVLGRKVTYIKCLLTSYQGHRLSTSLLMLTLATWLRSYLWGFSTVQHFPHLCTVFWKEITMYSPHLSGEFCSMSMRAEYLHVLELFCTGHLICLFFPNYLSIQSFTYVSMD